MMTNKLLANKLKNNNYEKILMLSEKTKNLYPMKLSKNKNIKNILLKIKLKSPIKRLGINKLIKNKTNEYNNQSNFGFDNDTENNKKIIGIINYKLCQPNNYYIRSNKLINNISNLNNSHNDKYTQFPYINNSKLRNKSLVQTQEKFDLNLKKIYLRDLSKDLEENDLNVLDKNINSNKIIQDEKKVNKIEEKIKLKKLLLMRNSTDYKLENKLDISTDKSHRNAKLLKKYYDQKIMKYNRLIKEMEEESKLKKNVMNNYINLMKETFEKNFEA